MLLWLSLFAFFFTPSSRAWLGNGLVGVRLLSFGMDYGWLKVTIDGPAFLLASGIASQVWAGGYGYSEATIFA